MKERKKNITFVRIIHNFEFRMEICYPNELQIVKYLYYIRCIFPWFNFSSFEIPIES